MIQRNCRITGVRNWEAGLGSEAGAGILEIHFLTIIIVECSVPDLLERPEVPIPTGEGIIPRNRLVSLLPIGDFTP
jgi:hypothetical protein